MKKTIVSLQAVPPPSLPTLRRSFLRPATQASFNSIVILILVSRLTRASFCRLNLQTFMQPSDFYQNLCQSCSFSDSCEPRVSSIDKSVSFLERVSSLEMRLPSHEN